MRSVGLSAVMMLLVLVGLMIAGCDSSEGNQPVPLQAPADFSGEVLRVNRGDGEEVLGSILVQGVDMLQSSDKYVVTIKAETLILKQDGKTFQYLTFSEIKAGQRVRIWFDGPVRESYPAQANAAQVMLVDRKVGLNEAFTLSVGQKIFIPDENLGITFVEISEDSRCPGDVTCIWAGRVVARVGIDDGNQVEVISLMQSGASPVYTSRDYGDYRLDFRVEPYPSIADPIDAASYRLTLIINKGTVGFVGTLKGHVTIGPLQPVVRPGDDPSDVPPAVYDARKIMVYDEFGDKLVELVNIGHDGNYSVNLTPGIYKVDINRAGVDFSKGLPAEITIESSKTVVLDIDIDTGIR